MKMDGELTMRMELALKELQSKGPSYMHSAPVADSQNRMIGKIQPKNREGVITWGRKIPLGDCEAKEVTIGRLHFRAIDFCDTIRLSERGRIHLENADAQDRNQFALLHAVAGTQWSREGRRNGAPTLPRVLAEAEEWGGEEFDSDRRAVAASSERKDWYALEVQSVAHDAVSCGHDRDYRGFVLFFRELFRRSNISIIVFDLGSREEGGYVLTVNLFVGADVGESQTMLIDLVAFRHRVRWLKLCVGNLAMGVRDWKVDFKAHLRLFVVEGWETKLGASNKENRTSSVLLSDCRFSKRKFLKIFSVPDLFYGNDEVQEAWNSVKGAYEVSFFMRNGTR